MAQVQVLVEAVVVTNQTKSMTLSSLLSTTPKSAVTARLITGLVLFMLFASSSQAAVLAEDRADTMMHYYSGGGITASGPAVLVRKGNNKSYSAFASYYVDNVTSASIDVQAQASKYTEERNEIGLGIDYLYNDTITSFSYNTSEESDYLSDSFNLDMSQEFFNGMTTFNMGYSTASDTVKRVDNDFSESLDRYRFRLGLSQILSKDWIASVNYENIAEKGFLNNPYRAARIFGAFVPEKYPSTRTSDAFAIRSLTYFDWRGSIRFDYRYFTDTWGIQGDTFEVGVSKYIGNKDVLELSLRLYSQSKASFYSDNFTADMLFMARDKELSTFSDTTVKVRYTYHMFERDSGFFSKANITGSVALINYQYDDFTRFDTGENYSYTAVVAQILLSLWY